LEDPRTVADVISRSFNIIGPSRRHRMVPSSRHHYRAGCEIFRLDDFTRTNDLIAVGRSRNAGRPARNQTHAKRRKSATPQPSGSLAVKEA